VVRLVVGRLQRIGTVVYATDRSAQNDFITHFYGTRILGIKLYNTLRRPHNTSKLFFVVSFSSLMIPEKVLKVDIDESPVKPHS
jgi:hypothetical protein